MANLGHILSLLGRQTLTIDQPLALRQSITRHEGLRLKPYPDSTGHLTIGYGHDLTDDGISPAIASALLTEDIQTAIDTCQRLLSWVSSLDDVRKRAFVEIVFNLGEHILTFHDALAAAQIRDWAMCVDGLQKSLWQAQVGHRAVVLESMLLTGQDPTTP